eukprot:TRINITY_DN8445_c0_g1_i1.p1 TRINITY_DN8445_c0_g1~~TRINITY_DN8445_c0_g1_i1.p1  ORF type:complete len:159 (+),score=34.91 TRINITY_DN8445_c0_g1_i1:63-539(+)
MYQLGQLFFRLVCDVFFFFFKQKTAYEMQRGLVGSEMCIRDRCQLILPLLFFLSLVLLYHILQNTLFAKQMSLQATHWLSCRGQAEGTHFKFLQRSIHSSNPHVLCVDTVSYTHLTLPTILLVQISVVAVSLKKKKKKKRRVAQKELEIEYKQKHTER